MVTLYRKHMAISLDSLSSPKSQLWFQGGDVEKKWTSLEQAVADHHFNHAIEVFLPNPVSGGISSTPPPYYLARFPVSHFLQPHICKQYCGAGNQLPVTALSVGRKIDVHCVFALHPPGKLLLSLDKDMYEQLGLQGNPSCYQKHRHVVQVDMTASSFTPGKPGYERVNRCLSEKQELEADFILAWDNIDPSSREKFMEDFKAARFQNAQDEATLTSLSLPVVYGDLPHGNHVNGEATVCSAEDLHTWLGGVACEMSFDEGAPGDFVSTFTSPEPSIPMQHGIRTRWSGMVTSSHICSMLREVRTYLSEVTCPSPWVAVSVWGFEDAPVSWKANEHGWFLSGDNHYQVVVFKTGQFWLLKSLGTQDKQS